jgi:hypothetical protein
VDALKTFIGIKLISGMRMCLFIHLIGYLIKHAYFIWLVIEKY